MGKRDGRQKGAQRHAEGQHGQVAHEALLAQLHSGSGQSPDKQAEPTHEPTRDPTGRHPIHEGRRQNDPADRAADKNRRQGDEQGHAVTPKERAEFEQG